MSRHPEKNPEIRKPEPSAPLFEQNFYEFEQKHSALPEIAPNPLNSAAPIGEPAQSHGEQKSGRTLPGENGDCTCGTQPSCGSPREESGRTETLPGAGEMGVAWQDAAPDKAHARRSDPATSVKAAAKVTHLGRTRDAIRKILELYGPSTDEFIRAMYIGMLERGEDIPFASPSGLRSRRSELVDFGFVCDSGELGETELGNSAIKWKLK